MCQSSIILSAGERSYREQADAVHPVERRLQGGVPEDQEQKGALVVRDGLTFSLTQGCEEGKRVQFQREIHLWPIRLLPHEAEKPVEDVFNNQPVHKSLQQQDRGL